VISSTNLMGAGHPAGDALRHNAPATARQQNSIMAGDVIFTATPPDLLRRPHPLKRLFNNTSSLSSLAQIGWRTQTQRLAAVE
jgi:hypothetical protein